MCNIITPLYTRYRETHLLAIVYPGQTHHTSSWEIEEILYYANASAVIALTAQRTEHKSINRAVHTDQRWVCVPGKIANATNIFSELANFPIFKNSGIDENAFVICRLQEQKTTMYNLMLALLPFSFLVPMGSQARISVAAEMLKLCELSWQIWCNQCKSVFYRI